MEIDKAREIVSLLAYGIDPTTGMEEKQTQNVVSGKPKNAGLPWTEELKEKVAIMFNNGTSVDELAEYFERTSGAILSQLMHQGLIDEESARKRVTTQSHTTNAAHVDGANQSLQPTPLTRRG